MKQIHNILSLSGKPWAVQAQASYTEYYLFNSAANMKAYSNNGLDFAYYGYNASNTRTYKLSMLNQNQWVNGQPEPLHLQLQSAMFYPNAYINFNQNGEYTKHYYNGTERIASRLGEANPSVAVTANARLSSRSTQLGSRFQDEIQELMSQDLTSVSSVVMTVNSLNSTGNPSYIYYYHTNHLGSTAYVTDQNQTVTQGFLYAPFGEITTEYNANFGNNVLPKYSFNAKELDEETGMYYYEARYYKPPVFTSRDAMMEKKPWLSPYHYCSNNPVGRVDPSGMFDDEAKANKFHHRAVKKYGCERVGDVYNAGTSEEPNYQFRIYDKGKEKDKQWNTLDEKGININAYRGNIISERRDYRNYKHSQGNDILTIQAKFTLGAQAGGKIKKRNVSVNIGSVDVASIKYSTGQKIKFDYVDEYGLTTYQMGLSLAFYGCKYTKEPYHDATFIYGPTITKKPTESLIGISREGINVSVGAALIFGIDLDIQYKW